MSERNISKERAMGKLFRCIIHIFRTIGERSLTRRKECASVFERAFLRLLNVLDDVGIVESNTVEALHAFYSCCVQAYAFDKEDGFGEDVDLDGLAETFLRFLFGELCLEREVAELVLDCGAEELLPESALKRSICKKRRLLKNQKYADMYFAYSEKYDGLSALTGMSKRDMYIPLKGKYLDRVNEEVFYLKDEIDRYVKEENIVNVLLLFGEAGQGKSTFVQSYFCESLFEEYEVFLFKLTEILPALFQGDGLDVGDFLLEYGIDRSVLHRGALFIFDGLDEATGELAARKYQLTEFINELADELCDTVKNSKLLLTSRPQGVEDRLIGYEKIVIEGLSLDDQKKWIHKYSTMSGDGEFSEDKLHKLRTTFPELTKLMETPLLFEMIVTYGVNTNIRNRVYLFERLFKESIRPERRKDIHRLFEKIAVEEFSCTVGSYIQESEVCDAYHQNFVEFYRGINGAVGAGFTHRSFYQHFLGYGLINAFVSSISDGALDGFLKCLGGRRLEKYELENIYWIIQKEHIGLTEEQIMAVFDEIVKNNGIYAFEDRCSLSAACIVFVNCINLINALAMKTIVLDGIRKEVFSELLKTYDNFGIRLTNFDLSFYMLVGARLANADLSGVDMRGCDLARADLCCANLAGADLNGSYLRGADLRGACLENANFSECNLSNSYLSGCNMRGCDLAQAYLINANILAADLRGANLKNANMQGAILNEASYEQESLDLAIHTREQLLAYLQNGG